MISRRELRGFAPIGMMEYWNDGKMGFNGKASLFDPNIPLFHHSIVPSLIQQIAEIPRRKFIASLIKLAGLGLLAPSLPALAALFPHFFFTQLQYKGGEWDPNPLFVGAMVEELELRTSIDGANKRRVVTVSDPELFYSPFLYLAGRYEFDPFTKEERETLRRFLTYGGFLLAEDTVGAKGFGFDRALRREMKEIFPDQGLKRLPPDHPVFQSFYLIGGSIGGRQLVNPYLEGITIGDWTPLIYSQNDLSGAWARDGFGKWVNDCIPGGEAQRLAAFKMGINIIVYSLTSDYKRDLIHHPFIRRRQKL